MSSSLGSSSRATGSDGSVASEDKVVSDGDALSQRDFESRDDFEMIGGLNFKGRLDEGGNKEVVNQQLLTSTEINLGSQTKNYDTQSPQVNTQHNHVHILSNNDLVNSSDSGKGIGSSRPMSIANATGFATITEAYLSIIKRYNASKKSNSDWISLLECRIAELGEELLDRKGITVPLNKRNMRILFKLKEDPKERTEALFMKIGMRDFKKKEFDHIADILKSHLSKELDLPGSSYSEMMDLKKELSLRQLRLEIINKIYCELWYFVLQHIPPIELKPKTTHCAHPHCIYHMLDVMPAGAYRLLFMNAELSCGPEHKFEEIGDEVETPGRTRNGQMLFCLECVEDLFNGVNLMKGKGTRLAENVDNRSPAGKDTIKVGEGGHPDPPDIKPRRMAPGIDIFTSELHTFIRPELRYTWHEFYTLNSFEYHAFMKWKNMCIRKTMWDVPSNRAFMLQISGVEEKYDFVDFFGDDILDNDEPQPSIVVGVALNVEEVSVDDISTLEYKEQSTEADVKENGHATSISSHPLSHISNNSGMDISQSKQPLGGSIGQVPSHNKTRVLHPLSYIMLLIDRRVQKAWAAMDPPYVPRLSKMAPNPQHRKWPVQSFWFDQLEKLAESHRSTKRNLDMMESQVGKGFSSDVESITEDVRPVSDQTPVTPRQRSDKKGRPGFCVTCGSIASPEWRNGPQGSNTLCNACGIRYTRGRGRRLVPPP